MMELRHEAGRGALVSSGLIWGVAFACLAALPVLAVRVPPLFDYANHLSRAHILATWDRSEIFQAWFEPSSLLIPNVLADLLLLGLAQLAGAESAGRALLLLIGALTIGGAWALGRAASGRAEIWSLFSGVFLYNEMLLWGFLNYMLGLGILLWGLAAWLHLERQSRTAQLAAGTGFALAIFFSHLVAFGLFAIAVATLELHRAWHGCRGDGMQSGDWSRAIRRLAVSAAIFAPPAALFLSLSPSRGLPAAMHFNFDPFAKLSPLTRLLASGSPVADTAVLLGTLGLVGALMVLRRIDIDRRLALVAGAYFLALLLLPYSAMHSFFIDSRVAVAVALVLLAGLRAHPTPNPAAERQLLVLGLAALMALMALRTTTLLRQWTAWDVEYRRILAAFESLPRGSLLIAATAQPFEYADGWLQTRRVHPPHEHTASWATIRRDAVVPGIFAKLGQNPLVFTPLSASIAQIALGPIPRVWGEQQLREIGYRASAVRAELDRAGMTGQGVFVVAFAVTCEDWPRGMALTAVSCGSSFSIVRTQRRANPLLAQSDAH